MHPSSTTLASVGELPHVVPSELPKLFKLPASALVTRNNKHQSCHIEFLKYKAYFIFHNSVTLSLILFGVVEPSLGEQRNLLVNESLFANSKEKKNPIYFQKTRQIEGRRCKTKPIGNQTFQSFRLSNNRATQDWCCHYTGMPCMSKYLCDTLFIYIFKFSFSDTLLLMCIDCLKISINSFAIYTIMIYFDNHT